jgi:hypothetical protein
MGVTPKSTNNATAPSFAVVLFRSDPAAASSPMMSGIIRGTVCRNAISHEHARSRGCFEDLVDTLDPQGRAFLVGSGSNGSCYTLALLLGYIWTRNVRIVVLEVFGPQVGFATDKNDGDNWSTNGSHFVIPL